MVTCTTRLSVADYLAMPDGPPFSQLLQGCLVQDPPPDLAHQLVLGSIYLLLAPFVRQRKLGMVVFAPADVVLSDSDVFQPDLLFVSTERNNRVSRRGVQGAPDLAVEVLSPSTARRDLGYKCSIYGQAGVREAWFVDLEQRMILLYRFNINGHPTVQRLMEADSLCSDLFPGLVIRLDEVFGPIRE